MDVSRNDTLREDNETVETITLWEIANEARERMMQDRLERMEKQMETLASILFELRDERDQPRPGRVLETTGRGASVDEGELRQRLQNAEQKRDQIAARDPNRAIELEGEVRRLAQVIEEIQGKRKPPSWRIMLDEESPLSTEIMGTIIPRDFRFPDLKYSGRSDPLVHIERFNDMTGVQGLTSAQRCRAFPLTLEGRAREWYRKLPRGSIKGYEQMCQELVEQFRGAVAPEDDMMELIGMKQEEHESLRDFVKRYHRAVLDLGAFNHPQALRGLKEGVRIGRLWYNLRSPLVQNYSAGYEQAKRDIEIEEEKSAKIKNEQLEELRRKERRTPNGSGSAKRAGEPSVRGGTSARSRPYPLAPRSQQFQHNRAQPPRPPFPDRQREFRQMAADPYHNNPRALYATNSRARQPDQLVTMPARGDVHDSRAVQLIDQSLTYRQYTPLKISMEELYERIEGRGLLYPPAPITKPTHQRDKSRFCKFHDTHGHTISQCRDLKIQVEDLVRNRYLDEYVDGTSPVMESQYTRDEGVERDLEREQPTIRVIAGGPTLAGDSNRARKNYGRYALTSKEVLFNLPATKKAKVRQVPIMWTDEDEEGILYPHEDALVIKASVASTELRRILVDTGSSVDILFKSALDDMGISDLKLERTNTSLKGFGGGRLTPLGIIELPITVGTKPFERTMMLDFVMVEERSPYQMILGRPFMRISQCVVSMHYLALKYRINGVVGVVKGDQRMARSC
ncbi:uncharacterized protein LOC127903038 [Citrus sinensis]|uniref:uncharacterized protein LOC127903038 n=1 Tax=Citrus sinensis TaxID=2711 RepID=UPI002278B68F|nr:uncharacterized protein LOC127903038 [Citrus sinensis]